MSKSVSNHAELQAQCTIDIVITNTFTTKFSGHVGDIVWRLSKKHLYNLSSPTLQILFFLIK